MNKAEFNVGDIAHFCNNKHVKGLYSIDTEDGEYFTTKHMQDFKITEVHKSPYVQVGYFVYNGIVIHNGKELFLFDIAQIALIGKKSWEYTVELYRRLSELI